VTASHCVPTASAAVNANRDPTASVRPVLRDALTGRGRTAEKETTMPNPSGTQSKTDGATHEHRGPLCVGCGKRIVRPDREWFCGVECIEAWQRRETNERDDPGASERRP
jgi:hypothetical protein